MPLRWTERGWIEPIRAFRAACSLPGRVFLDSGGPPGPLSRWSVLAVRPLEAIEVMVGDGLIAPRPGTDPFLSLASLHRRWSEPAARLGAASEGAGNETGREKDRIGGGENSGRGPFTGGIVALIGYDAGRALERVPALARDDALLPDLWAAAFDGALAFDRIERRVFASSWGLDGGERFAELAAILEAAGGSAGETPCPPGRAHRPTRLESRRLRQGQDRAFFEAGVSRIQEEIARGEVYQANLTRRVVRPAPAADPSEIYERLRAGSPTPFGAYVEGGSFQVLSASPERFVRITEDLVETRPIKGTRPRGGTDAEDARLRAELLASAKDRAELLMIVDLERNDLGRVCRAGTVAVEDFPAIESYSTVSHLVATVSGRLRPGVDPIAVLRAAFPGGSITGAPKLRAMEILEQLEPYRRKLAMGSLVAWDFGGYLDSSILIRTLVVRSGEAVFHVGAGIVSDSDPRAEYLETVAKAAPLVAALEGA